MNTQKDRFDLADLLALMQRLRDPDQGCPWDIAQDFNSIKPHTIEEAYEVADAIERQNMPDLKDELGDLLFQVIFHAQIAAEDGHFTMNDVIDHVTRKMIFRHPHVFTDQKADTAQQVEDQVWEQQKAKEKENKNTSNQYYLDDVTMALPSLLLANKIQKRVRKIGFAYPDILSVFDKMQEEINELRSALDDGNHIQEEYGDLLLVTALLGAHLRLNPEETLRQAILKFKGRFDAVETALKNQGQSIEDASIEDMSREWTRVKKSSAGH